MTDNNSALTTNLTQGDELPVLVEASVAMSPYATGGGGVTFERKVAVQYLAHLLTGNGAAELGDGRRVVSVAFQQAPESPVDDLVIAAAFADESEPSLLLSLGVRRSPNLVQSDQPTRKLIWDYVSAVISAPADGPEHRLGLVVAGPQPHAQQLQTLAGLAAVQMDAPGFFDLVETPNRFAAGVRGRLVQFEGIVGRVLRDLGVANPGKALIRQRTWELLSKLTVLMPRLESPDETDWAAITNNLVEAAKTSDLEGATRLRDRLAYLAGEYAPKAARVDLNILRRDAHEAVDPNAGRHQQGWQVLEHLHNRALNSVRDEIVAGDGRRLRIDRSGIRDELASICSEPTALVVSGESGVGKSVLALRSLTSVAEDAPEFMQAQCINLRHIHKLTVELESTMGCPAPTIFSEFSAPQRMLVIDGADAVAEGREQAFHYLVEAAAESDVKVIAVTAVDNKQVVRDILKDHLGTEVVEFAVPPLDDAEIQEIVDTFPELENIYANVRSRELLRRLVVVDLLVRSGVAEVPLSDSDAMREIWSGLVRKRESADRGHPDAREFALLRLADLELSGGDRLSVLSGIDAAALAGLRQDGLLQASEENPFMIGPDFSHDEVRRYAVARLLLSENDPTARLLNAGVPRWVLSAASLASATLLELPDGPHTPLLGRFGKLQSSFDAVVEAGHGARWGDVPGEAMLSMSDASAVLRDAWPQMKSGDAAGLQRLARLVDQRLRDPNGIVNPVSIEPIVSLMLEDRDPWRSGEYASNLLKDWLRGHVVAGTSTGNPTRIRLRERLMEAYVESDRRLEERLSAQAAARTQPDNVPAHQLEQTHPELFFSQLDYGGPPRRERPQVPSVCRDRNYLELLALLGADLGDEGEAILARIAQDAPSSLAPALEALFTPPALSQYRRGLLAELTEAYYMDDEGNGRHIDDDGIRGHDPRYSGIWQPLSAWHRGPFWILFQTDVRGGIAVLNRLLNHAALHRARTLARLHGMAADFEGLDISPYQVDMEVAGTRRSYVGDEHVWYWYRGTAVGPYPCISALQALERACDLFIEQGIPIGQLARVLLEGCQNLAMVGLVTAILVRHLEAAGDLLDPYFADPMIWHLEFRRVALESSTLAASSEGIEAPDRRRWSLREAATVATLSAGEERAAVLRNVGETLVENARAQIADGQKPTTVGEENADNALAVVIAWASCLDRNNLQLSEAPGGLYIQATPPEDVVQKLHDGNRDIERSFDEINLSSRYLYKATASDVAPFDKDELEAGISTARDLLENPTSFGAHHPWDLPAAIAATALESHLLRDVDVDSEALAFAAEVVLRVSEGEALTGLFDFEESYFEAGADRSAARVLPLLLTPAAAPLRALVDGGDGSTAIDRIFVGGLHLAEAMVNEVRLHLARGLDKLWSTPCVHGGMCHHKLGWELAKATMQGCVLGDWDRVTGGRSAVTLDEPVAKSLKDAPDQAIEPFRLDAAIRGLAPAAMASICASADARDLLMVLLDAQSRALVRHKHNNLDDRGTHALVAARALLELARDGYDTAIYERIDAYADSAPHFGELMRGLSASAEETPDRAATAQRIWPDLMLHVLALADAGHTPFQGDFAGDMALAALLPNRMPETHYLYRELQGEPITWWDPTALRSEVGAWLASASGNAMCVDQLVSFLEALTSEDQVRLGLPWIAELVLAKPQNIANRTYLLANWLIETRAAAAAVGLSDIWQQIVDALVVEGDSRLAPYSE